MNAKAKIDIVSDDSELVKALNRATKLVEKLAKANKKLKTETKASAKEAKSGFGGMAAGAIKAAAGVLTVSAAIAAVNNELATRLKLEKEIAGSAITLAQAQRSVDINLGLDASVTRRQRVKFQAALTSLSSELKFGDETGLVLGASRILSATQGNRALALETVREVAQFSRGKPEGIGDIGTQVAQLQQSAGISPKEGTQLVLSLAGLARTEELGQLKVTGGVAAAFAKAFPENKVKAIEQGFAIFAAGGGESGEGGGKQTATAAIATANKLAALTGGKGTPFEAAQLLRSLPVAQQRKFTESGFEKQVKASFVEFLTAPGGGATGESARRVQAKFDATTRESLLAAAERQRSLTPEIRAATAREANAAREQAFAKTAAGRAILFKGTVRGTLESALKTSQILGARQTAALKQFDLTAGDDPQAAAIKVLGGRQEEGPTFRDFLARNVPVLGLRRGERTQGEIEISQAIIAIDALSRKPQIRTNAEGDE